MGVPGAEKPRILVVDDEETLRYILQALLTEKGCEVRTAESAEQALSLLWKSAPAVALVDIVLPGMNGLDLLREIKRMHPDTEVLVITSQSTGERARQAIKSGAFDYLEKPFPDLEVVWNTVQRALEKRSLKLRKQELIQEQEKRSAQLSSAIPVAGVAAGGEPSGSFTNLLEFSIQMISDELGVEFASILLVDEAGGELNAAASQGVPLEELRKVRQRSGVGLIGLSAERGKPHLSTQGFVGSGVEYVPQASPSDVIGAAPIAMSLPIKSGDRVLGVISVSARRSGEPFTPDDLAHVTALAGQLAGAIEGTRAYERLHRAHETLQLAQKQLVSSERLKAVGQMAAGVAHDFNNVLSIILGRAQLLLRQLREGALDPAAAEPGLQSIVKTALQGVETIKRIQDFSRIRKDVPRSPVDLREVVEDAVEIARPKWKEQSEAEGRSIEVQLDFGDVPPVGGNLYELKQAVSNLIFNAVEAMPQGGRLSFRTRGEGDTAVLEVADTGIGMDEETCKRVFEPFYSTKPNGQGLGASIIYGIVTRHRGQITAHSKPGAGTTFRMTLPRLRGEAPVAAPQEDLSRGRGGPARVLLIDDDAEVRDVYRQSLEEGDHEVVALGDGREAVARFRKGKFDIVITDLSMPGMSGFDVAREVRRIKPDVPVILLSGWSIEQDDEKVRSAGITQVLIKPCLFDDLLEAVRKVVETPVRA
jgi:CheY-like chemotaxis protein